MREILFRGKRLDSGEWIEGFYYSMAETTYCFEEDYKKFPVPTHHYIMVERMTDWGLPNRMCQAEVNPETVCQYTGYMDLWAKKAFEHDIVFYEDEGCYGHIVFKEGQFLIKWQESRPDLRSDIHFWFTKRRLYIVGNVFDNPELMEVDDETD